MTKPRAVIVIPKPTYGLSFDKNRIEANRLMSHVRDFPNGNRNDFQTDRVQYIG